MSRALGDENKAGYTNGVGRIYWEGKVAGSLQERNKMHKGKRERSKQAVRIKCDL